MPVDTWLDWSDGVIYSKSPCDALIDKMVRIAWILNADVRGEEGEYFDGGNLPPRYPTLSLKNRLKLWFDRFRPKTPLEIVHDPLPFKVGDRVKDTWWNMHIVIHIDPKAEHGIGLIRTRRSDGVEISHHMINHGLTPITIDD